MCNQNLINILGCGIIISDETNLFGGSELASAMKEITRNRIRRKSFFACAAHLKWRGFSAQPEKHNYALVEKAMKQCNTIFSGLFTYSS